ncbi:anoctamin-6 isoform X1 [Musca autumnalis]|uniref:anoctamin-6 isoform X1 n=2 Tax=Musca autumnalis TaxID=221902 RepID=UPI003CFBACF7
MYSAVRTHDYDYPESEMDDRESLYFDTISLADSEAAAAAAAHRKSLSQSRNTIYYSAADLAGDETPARRSNSIRLENGLKARASWNPNYRHSSPLDHYLPSNTNGNGAATTSAVGGGADYTDAVIAAQVMALQNGRSNYINATGASEAALHNMTNDMEVSRRLIQNSAQNSRDKKLPITYSQWKFRTRRRFQDGVRGVDYVLAYNGSDHKLDNIKKRETFEANLEKEGLHLERDNTQRIHFIKIHAPKEVLYRYAEILKIKLPMKKIPGQDQIYREEYELSDSVRTCCGNIFKSIQLNPEKFPPKPKRIHFEFQRNYEHLFDCEQPNFFDAGTRIYIINFILERQHFIEGEETPDNLGIEKLLADGVYECAYTLHDDTDRDLLLSEWANIRKWKHLQPLDAIKEYFGAKVAIYFAWLGFYTHMLIPVSIFGILFFIYGFITWHNDPISQEICNANKTTLMCPQCDRNCDYWELKNTCASSKMNYLIDNNMTVLFAFIMSMWAVTYLELWKRYSARLIHRWGLTGYTHDVEHPRPQYLQKLRKNRKLAQKLDQLDPESVFEPEVPFWTTKFVPSFTSYSLMVLSICISLIAIFSMVVYRMAQRASHSVWGDENSATYKIMAMPFTAGIIDLIVISILDYAYSSLAVKLTDWEYCRTQTEYDESLTIKHYVFQFVNYYSSLFYIAFLKGKFVGYPMKYNTIFGFRQEECSPGGCLMELCIQLIIIMVGKQAVNAIIEMLVPYLMKKFRKFSTHVGLRRRKNEEKLVSCNQWTEDYHLEPWTNTSMFGEYLEMVIQFGFITLFGLAFPLAPLLALINNVIEVRLDAVKMLKFIRRPVAQRARDIGVWFNIMTVVTKIAVASCAMIIAFSTNLIPKLIYRHETQDYSMQGYLNFTLAYFDTKDYKVQPILGESKYGNVTECRYSEFRNPPWHEHPYKRPMYYWKILIIRLAFIVIFQNVIGVLQTIIAWAIPDVSGKLLRRIKRENFLLREHIIEYEKRQAQKEAAKKLAEKVHGLASNVIKGITNNINNNALNNGGGTFSDPIEEEDDDVVQLRKRNIIQDDTTQL